MWSCSDTLADACKRFHAIAEHERKKRQDISKLLKRYVDDTDGFRRLMRDTGAIIVGDFARAFFTGEDPSHIRTAVRQS